MICLLLVVMVIFKQFWIHAWVVKWFLRVIYTVQQFDMMTVLFSYQSIFVWFIHSWFVTNTFWYNGRIVQATLHAYSQTSHACFIDLYLFISIIFVSNSMVVAMLFRTLLLSNNSFMTFLNFTPDIWLYTLQ